MPRHRDRKEGEVDFPHWWGPYDDSEYVGKWAKSRAWKNNVGAILN